jgi:hypothetical protein
MEKMFFWFSLIIEIPRCYLCYCSTKLPSFKHVFSRNPTHSSPKN